MAESSDEVAILNMWIGPRALFFGNFETCLVKFYILRGYNIVVTLAEHQDRKDIFGCACEKAAFRSLGSVGEGRGKAPIGSEKSKKKAKGSRK